MAFNPWGDSDILGESDKPKRVRSEPSRRHKRSTDRPSSTPKRVRSQPSRKAPTTRKHRGAPSYKRPPKQPVSQTGKSKPDLTGALGVQLPPWIQSDTARPGRGAINRTAPAPRTYRLRVATSEDRLPLLYGEVLANGLIFAVAAWSSTELLLGIAWGEGPVQSIDQLYYNDKPKSPPATHYTGGSGNVVDPWLQSKIPGYNDTLPGVAYSVLRVSKDDGLPTITARIRGRNDVLDYSTNTTGYTTNPAYVLAHIIANRLGRQLDTSSVIDAANYCDEVMADGNPRRRLGLVLHNNSQSTGDAIEALRAYAGCIVVDDGSKIRLIPDKTGTSVKTFDASNIMAGTIRLKTRGHLQRPNTVELVYTDISTVPWAERSVVQANSGVTAATERRAKIRLPGITNGVQAKREAIERLNYYNLIDLEGEFVTTDDALEVLPGDIVTINHPIGLSGKLVRVMSMSVVDPGRYRIKFEEYQPNVYSNSIETAPVIPDTQMDDPGSPPSVTGLTATEELYQQKDGTWSSRFRVTWSSINYQFAESLAIDVLEGSSVKWSVLIPATETSYLTGSLIENTTYTVRARIISSIGASGPLATVTATAQGKTLPPSDVPGFGAGIVRGIDVRLTWSDATDIDVWRYKIREGTSWSTATDVALVDALEYEIIHPSKGAHTYLIKCIDSVGGESANAQSVTVNVPYLPAPGGFSGLEAGGQVRLKWQTVQFAKRYHVRYGAPGVTWANATQIDAVDTLALTADGIPQGDWDFLIRTEDQSETVGTDESRINALTVTSDVKSFLVGSHDYTAPTSTTGWTFVTYDRAPKTDRWITDDGQTWASKFPSEMSTYSQRLINYYADPGYNNAWVGESYDLGSSITGNFLLDVYATEYEQALDKTIELSDDASTWSQHSGTSVNGTARYMRPRLVAQGGTLLQVPAARMSVTAVPREESISQAIQTVASGPKRIPLANVYGAVQTITLTPVGNTSISLVADNIVLGTPPGNLDFETGVLAPWERTNASGTVSVTSATSHNGVYAGQIGAGAALGSAAFGVNGGAVIDVFVWIRASSSGGSHTLRANYSDGSHSGDVIQDSEATATETLASGSTSTTWTKIDATLNVPTGATHCTLVLQASNKDHFIDDVKIYLNSFDVYAFDSNNNQVVADFLWSFKGV